MTVLPRQLGELKKNEAKFKAAGAEVIAVFREEQKGVEGLKLIKKKSGVSYTLALDTGKKQTPRYSPGKKEFTNYVLDKNGMIAAVITGDLRNRANSKQLLKAIADISASSKAKSDNKGDQEAKSGSGKK